MWLVVMRVGEFGSGGGVMIVVEVIRHWCRAGGVVVVKLWSCVPPCRLSFLCCFSSPIFMSSRLS